VFRFSDDVMPHGYSAHLPLMELDNLSATDRKRVYFIALEWPKRVFRLFLIARNAASGYEDRSDDVSSKMQEMRPFYIVRGITLRERPLCGLCQNRNC
jgi:hypothetical protein